MASRGHKGPWPEGDRAFLWLVAGLCATVTLIVFWPILARGGFAIDDWAQAARVLEPAPGQTPLGATLDVTGARLGSALYQWLTFAAFGLNARAHLIVAAALGVTVAVCVARVLRSYGAGRPLALGAAVLSVVLPAGAVSRAWVAVAAGQLGVVLFLLGLLAAHAALRRSDARLHGLSLALYTLSVFEQELTLPWVAAAVVWHAPVAGWPAALRRWPADLAVAGVAVLVYSAFAAPSQQRSPVEEWAGHAADLLDASLREAGNTLTLHAGAVGPVAGALLTSGAAVAAVLAWRRGSEARMAAGAFVLGTAGFAMAMAVYVPGNPALLPDLPGPLGRTSVAGAAALAVALGGCLTAAASLAGRRSAWLAAGLLSAVGAGAGLQTHREMDAWAAGAERERAVLTGAEAAVGTVPPGATVIVLGAPGDVPVQRGARTQPITVFQQPFVVNGAVRAWFADSRINGVVVRAGDVVHCRPAAVVVTRPNVAIPLSADHELRDSLYGLAPEFHRPGSAYNIPDASYGRAVIVDLRTGKAARPLDVAACQAAVELSVPAS